MGFFDRFSKQFGLLGDENRIQSIDLSFSYTGLGYTGIRTYRTENFSPAQKQLTVCFVQSVLGGIRIYRISYVYRTVNLSPNQSGIRAIDCIKVCNNGIIDSYYDEFRIRIRDRHVRKSGGDEQNAPALWKTTHSPVVIQNFATKNQLKMPPSRIQFSRATPPIGLPTL